MSEEQRETVLLVCSDHIHSNEILDKLFDRGFGVIGPVSTAAMALAIAAQSSPTLAVVARAPTGRRDAPELARELMRNWGVRSLLLDDAHREDLSPDLDQAGWAPSAAQLARLRGALQ